MSILHIGGIHIKVSNAEPANSFATESQINEQIEIIEMKYTRTREIAENIRLEIVIV